MRTAAQNELQAAKKALAAEVEATHTGNWSKSTDDLANEIADAILGGAPPEPVKCHARGNSMRFWRGVLSRVAGALAIVVLTTMPLLAAEGEANPADSTTGVIFRWLNFALVFGGLGYLIARHGKAFFGANAKAIASSITEAQAARAAADRELSDVNAKISRLDQEVANLRESARRDAAAEAERLRASGQIEIKKLSRLPVVSSRLSNASRSSNCGISPRPQRWSARGSWSVPG